MVWEEIPGNKASIVNSSLRMYDIVVKQSSNMDMVTAYLGILLPSKASLAEDAVSASLN